MEKSENKGKLIVFEGIDCCFKETQSKMLSYYLKQQYRDKKIILVDFPRYSSPTGQIIFDILHNNVSDINILPINFISDCYTIDRAYEWYKNLYNEFYNNEAIIICDRWTYSNCIYQGARYYINGITDEAQLSSLMISIYINEFQRYRLPRPDLTLHMSMKYDNILKIISKKKDKDIIECDTEYLSIVNKMDKLFYGKIMVQDKTIVNIVCDNEDGSIKTREEIHDGIYEAVKNILKGES